MIARIEWRKLIGRLSYIGYFPQKRLMMSGVFAERDLHFEASYGSSPPLIRNAHTYAPSRTSTREYSPMRTSERTTTHFGIVFIVYS